MINYFLKSLTFLRHFILSHDVTELHLWTSHLTFLSLSFHFYWVRVWTSLPLIFFSSLNLNNSNCLCVTSLPSPAQSTQAFGSPFLQEAPCQVSPMVMVLSPLQPATFSGTEGTGHIVATTGLVLSRHRMFRVRWPWFSWPHLHAKLWAASITVGGRGHVLSQKTLPERWAH